MYEFSSVFRAFHEEALFTKEMLGLGATRIRKADFANRGIYYEAFTCLSTGLERIGKLCLILDYYIDNKGTLPDFKYMKNEIGHNLIRLYNKSSIVVAKHNINFDFKENLNDEIYKRILQVLSEFATGDRYSNINILSNMSQKKDFMSEWYQKIDEYIFEFYLSKKKKDYIKNKAHLTNIMLRDYTSVLYFSETGEAILDLENASWCSDMQMAVAPYRQLFVLKMIRYWVELIEKLGNEARRINLQQLDIPYFSEIFGGFYNDDSYFRSRKTWDKI